MDRPPSLRVCAAVVVASCASPRAQVSVAPTPRQTTDAAVRATADATTAAPRDPELYAWNLAAREGAVTETLHGERVEDPYRSLETDSPGTRAWIDHQTARSTAYLQHNARPGMTERLRTLLSIGVLRSPATAGGKVFFLKRDGAREQAVLMVAERTSPSTTFGAARSLVDPADFGVRGSIDWYFPSPRGRFVAFGVSQNGDERSTLFVVNTATGELLEEAIHHAKWCRLAWMPDETGFYYTRYPSENEPRYDPAEPDAYWRRLYFHRLVAGGRRAPQPALARRGHCPEPRQDCVVAGPAAAGAFDREIFSGTERTDAPSPSLSSDGRWLVVNLFVGWSRQDVFLIDRRLPVAPDRLPQAFPLTHGTNSLSTAMVHRGKVYVVTNLGAARYRVVTVDAAVIAHPQDPNHTPGSPPPTLQEPLVAPWRELIAEGPHPIDEVLFAGERMVISTLENIASRVRVHALTGEVQSEITLPAEGSVSGIDGSSDDRTVALLFESFFHPPEVLAATLPTQPGSAPIVPARIEQVQTDFDPSAYELERQSVPSRDGTPINVFYMHRRGMARDGRQPVLLTGYGGFNVSLGPSFARDPLYWLERGGVYAIANLRGGSEFGEQWHRDGALGNKTRVFEDFEAVIRWFGTGGVSSPSRIALRGGSNGGLLMGAMLTRAPDAFRATIARVGLYDMVRFHRFPPAQIWTSEYGSAEDPTQFAWLYAYSPYHRLHEGVFPAAWIETADHDSRVFWGHSTKFAARLQESQTGPLPIYFFMQQNVGHGAGTRLGDQIDRYVREYTFLEDQLGIPAATP